VADGHDARPCDSSSARDCPCWSSSFARPISSEEFVVRQRIADSIVEDLNVRSERNALQRVERCPEPLQSGFEAGPIVIRNRDARRRNRSNLLRRKDGGAKEEQGCPDQHDDQDSLSCALLDA
jgi:hypothetical protein